MANLKSMLFAIALSGFVTSAVAGNGDLTVTVSPIAGDNSSTPISFGNSSSNFVSWIGYKVYIQNPSTNTINNVVFVATHSSSLTSLPTYSTVTGTNVARANTPPTCSATNSGAGVSCQIGQLQSGATSGPFYVYFNAPDDPLAGSGGSPTTAVTFSGRVWFAEGANGGNSTPNNSWSCWSPDNVATDPNCSLSYVTIFLGTANNTFNIKSAVPKLSGSLNYFTAPNKTGDVADQIRTLLTVPSLNNQTTALDYSQLGVLESSFYDTTCQNAKNFNPCYQTQVSIRQTAFDTTSQRLEFPAAGPYYIITEVRVGPGGILPGLNVNKLTIQYVDDNTLQVTTVGLCSNGYAPPCLTQPINYYKNANQAPSADLVGVIQLFIKHWHNGTIKLF